MKNKVVISIILLSMTLHCCCRVGLLSYLYEQRHQLAYAIGLVAEIPIALCNSDYNFGSDLVITEHADQTSIPPTLQAREINLYFKEQLISVTFEGILLGQSPVVPYQSSMPGTPADPIFQPPRV